MIDLWLATAQNRSKGILTGMTEADIALDAQWDGDPAYFCKALTDVGFLDKDEGGTYSIHDWKDHQPFAYYAEERSFRAKRAIMIRWAKRDAKITEESKGDNTDSIRDVYDQKSECNTPSPSPYPIPSPNPKKTSLSSSQMTVPQNEIVELYHRILPELPPVKHWTEERQKNLRARWKEETKRQSLDWWEKYFEHVRESPFLMGNGNKKWQPNLEWFVKKTNLVNVIEGKYHNK